MTLLVQKMLEVVVEVNHWQDLLNTHQIDHCFHTHSNRRNNHLQVRVLRIMCWDRLGFRYLFPDQEVLLQHWIHHKFGPEQVLLPDRYTWNRIINTEQSSGKYMQRSVQNRSWILNLTEKQFNWNNYFIYGLWVHKS